ncbi:MAG: DUF1415 family protein [Lewinella sp.]|uniref:DUF1415 family protein n=1 Tax=Lewinella sp. TaxID=2004506 RepID=UPI003D6C6E9F
MKEIQVMQSWLAGFVIEHNICPFAKRPFTQDRIRIRVVETDNEEVLTKALLEELSDLVTINRAQLETTLLVFPNLFSEFDDFWAYWEWTQDLLVASKTEGLIQLVGFHPDFYFGESDQDDLANYTNRSPYPLIHLLREESVEDAISQFSGIDQIPDRNATYLRTLSKKVLENLRIGHHD